MAQVQLRIAVHKRWFFWPVFYGLVALAKIGLVRDFYRAADWLTTHGIVWEAA